MLARSSIPRRRSPRPARGHQKEKRHCCRFSFWCPREESNLDYELRKLASYPLNDGGVTECISESKPRRHQIAERMRVIGLVDVMQEMRVYHVGVDSLKGDD